MRLINPNIRFVDGYQGRRPVFGYQRPITCRRVSKAEDLSSINIDVSKSTLTIIRTYLYLSGVV